MVNLFLVIILCQGISTTAITEDKTTKTPISSTCVKGERGEKGEQGICPANCMSSENVNSNECLGSTIQLQHLSQSIRQLIMDTKTMANRNARTTPCECVLPPPPPPPTTTTTTTSTTFSTPTMNYDMYRRLKGEKGEKGDSGASCPSSCLPTTRINIRVFPTIKAAIDSYYDYPDYTYVHIVNEYGRLQNVLIRIQRRLVPIKIEPERAVAITGKTLPSPLSTPPPSLPILTPSPASPLLTPPSSVTLSTTRLTTRTTTTTTTTTSTTTTTTITTTITTTTTTTTTVTTTTKTTTRVSRKKCIGSLPCSNLHLFALGPQTRKMCYLDHPNGFCSKLSDYDSLCGRESERHKLKGFYRAFMSSSTQWMARVFNGICVHAKFVNMREQVLFDSFEEIFERKSAQNEILDVEGFKPQFQYWWHGTLPNGTASSNTCLDWSRRNSSISGIASRISNGAHGLFHYQYVWPCSISDSNMGILCIETTCDKQNYYKH